MKRGASITSPEHQRRFLDRIARQLENQASTDRTAAKKNAARYAASVRWLLELTKHPLEAELGESGDDHKWNLGVLLVKWRRAAQSPTVAGDPERLVPIKQGIAALEWGLEALEHIPKLNSRARTISTKNESEKHDGV